MNIYTADYVWSDNLKKITNDGLIVNPRSIETFECIGFQSVIDMNFPVVTNICRRLSFEFMAAEALWILNGENSVEPLKKHAPSIVKFSDDGKILYGAYGPQLMPQIDYVIQKLVDDINTRQAIATTWIRSPMPSKDIPCTISLQWIIRGNEIHCIDSMRSSDIWLGWPYDIFSFSMVTAYIAIELRRKGLFIEMGRLFLNVGSQHLYKSNLARATECIQSNATIQYAPFDIGRYATINDLKENLNRISTNTQTIDWWLHEIKKEV